MPASTELTYLELIHRLWTRLGYQGAAPSSITGQSGRAARVVDWINFAWWRVQNAQKRWRWMRKQVTFDTVAATTGYSPTTIGIDLASNPTTGLGTWRFNGEPDKRSGWTSRDESAAEPESTVRELYHRPWDHYIREVRGRTLASCQPREFTIEADNTVRFLQSPDDVYRVYAEYYRAPYMFTAAGDIPDLPAEYHDLIWLTAIDEFIPKENAGEFQGYLGIRDEMMMQLISRYLDAENETSANWRFGQTPLA